MSFSRSTASRNGASAASEARVELSDRGFDLFDRLQVLADQEAMMVARTPLQGGGEVLARAGEPGMAEFGQPSRIALPPRSPSGCAGR
jgi:hypothetical protein